MIVDEVRDGRDGPPRVAKAEHPALRLERVLGFRRRTRRRRPSPRRPAEEDWPVKEDSQVPVPPHEAVADESEVVWLWCCNWLLEIMREAVVPVFHWFGETQCLLRG